VNLGSKEKKKGETGPEEKEKHALKEETGLEVQYETNREGWSGTQRRAQTTLSPVVKKKQ